MKEAYQLIWTGIGAIAGLLAGFAGVVALFGKYGDALGRNGGVAVLVGLGLCGGGMALGGYLALLIAVRRDKMRRRVKAAQKKARRKKK